MDIFFIILVDI